MSASLRETELSIRTCILYEALDDKPIEESFKNFCRKVGKGAMTLYDFDYWFYRFHNGNHDLHHDRSKDPKQLTLSDMPIGVMPEILSNVDPIDRLVLRKVSQGLRHVVKSIGWEFDTLTFIKDTRFFRIHFPSSQTIYNSKENGCSVTQWREFGDGKPSQFRRKFVEGGDKSELLYNDCKILLENKVFALKSFDFSIWHTMERLVKNILTEPLKSSNLPKYSPPQA